MGHWHGVEPWTHLFGQFNIHKVDAKLAVKHPRAGLSIGHRLSQQVVHLQHLDAALDHRAGEGIVVVAGLRNPQHIVKQQLMAIGGGESLLRKPWAAHQHFAQASYFRMQSLGHGHLPWLGANFSNKEQYRLCKLTS